MLSKKFQLFRFALVSVALLACMVSSGWAQWTVDITVSPDDPLVLSQELTFGTDISVPSVQTPFPPPPMSGNYLNAAFKEPTGFEKYYSTYTDADGPWLLRIQTNVGFTLEWDGLEKIDDGNYHISSALYSADNPRLDWGLLRSQLSSTHLSAGNYFIRITKISASERTTSLVSGQQIAFQSDVLSTGTAIELVSGTAGDVTVQRNDETPADTGKNVLPVNWMIDSELTGVSVTLYFYYHDAEITAAGLNENTMMLGFNNGSSWQVAPTQRDTTKNKLWTITDHFSSTWAIGEESSLPVSLSSFVGRRDSSAEGITLEWSTSTEVNSLQWNIYRSESKDGKYTKINSKGIPAAGNSNEPKNYKYVDETVIGKKTYYYYLEIVDVQGNTERFTLITVVPKFDLKTSFHTTWGKLKSGY